MADIYSTVQFTIQILQPYIEKEVSLIRGLQDKVKDIRDELNIMLAWLGDTDKRAKENESVKEWMKQMRTLAHDIEDVTEAYKLFQKENAFGKVKQCLSLKVRDIASTIESLRERAKELGRRKDSYPPKNNGDSVVQQEHDCSQIQGTFSVCLAQESELVGAETAEQDLIKKLGLQELDEDSRLSRMIAVIGKEGLGKTSVVWSVYNDGNVKDYFPIRAWVQVVRPYNLVDVLKSIIKQFYKAAGELHVNKDRIDSMDVISLENLVKSYLEKRYMAAVNPFKKKKKRYMVVIDDVQDLDGDRELANYIKRLLPTDNNKGSKIIMTTRYYESVACTWLDGSDHGLYKLEPLEPAKAWELFCKKAFHRHGGKCPSLLHDVARDIVNRCEGVPLIVVEMGRFLSIKPYDRHEWIKVQQNLGFFLQNNLTGLHNILNHSYHSLLSHLKPCFLYFGLFPKGYTVDRMRLIRLWIAEGFIMKQSSSNLTLEEVAEEYIDHLIHMSLVEVEYADATGKPKTLRVHEFLHEIILSKVKELDFCHTLPESNSNIIDLSVVPRRLSINVNPAKEIIIGSKSNTRSILLITDNSSPPVKLWPKVLTKALNNNRQLKVLDLCNAPIDEFPKEVGKLLNLQYLSLRNTRVKMIPSSIGKLQDLQTLDLKQTPIRELPAEINELHKLRHLLTYCYEYDPAFSRHAGKITGVKIPNGALEKFEGLQKLAFVDVEHTSTVIKELRNLRQLRKLGIVGLKLEHGEDLCAAIAEMKCLLSFSVYSENKTKGMDLKHLHQSLPSTLKRLYLNGRLKNRPLEWCFNGWISKLHSLVKLRLRWSCLEVDPLPILETLPNLAELHMLEAYNGDNLIFENGGFKKLKTLNLLDLRNLKSLSICKGALPHLQLMAIGESPKLEVPLGIEHLSSLETLDLFDMPLDFAHSLQQPDGIYHSIVRPNVRLFKINNQGIWYPTAL